MDKKSPSQTSAIQEIKSIASVAGSILVLMMAIDRFLQTDLTTSWPWALGTTLLIVGVIVAWWTCVRNGGRRTEELTMQQIRTLKQDLKDLQKQLAEKDVIIMALVSVVKSVDHMREERVRLDEEREDLAKRDVTMKETIAEMETQVLAFRESQSALEMDKDAHEVALQAFEEEREEWTNTKDMFLEEISTLRTTVMNQLEVEDAVSSSLKVELSELKSKFEAQAKVNAALGEKATIQEKMIRIMTGLEKGLREELDSVVTAVEDIKRTLEEKEEEFATLQRDMTELRAKYMATLEANIGLLREIEGIEEENPVVSTSQSHDASDLPEKRETPDQNK